MKLRFSGLCGVVAVSALLTAPAQAAVPDKAWAYFMDNSLGKYGNFDPNDFEDQLYAAGKDSKSQAAAFAAFAKRLSLTPAEADAYATLIIDVRAYFDACDNACDFAPGVPIYEETSRVALTEPSGRLLGQILASVRDYDHSRAAVIVRLAWRHPHASAVLIDLDSDSFYTAAALARLPADSADLPGILPGEPFGHKPDEMNGWVPAILEDAEARMAAAGNVKAQVAIARFALEQQIAMGFDKAAADKYLGYPQTFRDALAYMPEGTDKAHPDALISNPAFTMPMGAALWANGHRNEAEVLLTITGTRGHLECAERQDYDMLTDAMLETRAGADLFTPYALGLPLEKGQKQSDCHMGLNGSGWLQAAAIKPPVVKRLVAARLTKAGYTDMADWLRQQKPYYDTHLTAVFPALAADLPAAAAAAQPKWAAAITAAQTEATPAPTGVLHVSGAAMPDVLHEKSLSAGIAAWDGKAKSAVPKGVKLPVPADSVLRYESSGTDAAIVYDSPEYDLAGEIPAYGLWLDLKRGGSWQKPLYLGIQQYFPFVVASRSGLPMISGDRLTLEVRIKEIDPESITFPPVGLRYKRETGGVYIDAALAEVAADRDGDGLTDIEEARLGLDPAKADSDGDGLPDGVDPLPLTAYDAKADPRAAAVAKVILEHLAGHDAGAIVLAPREGHDDNPLAGIAGLTKPSAPRRTLFLGSDIDLFSGIAGAPFRLVVYSPADIEKLGRDKAPFYPPRITSLFRSLDGSRYFVAWSASWTGGSFVVTCKDLVCTTEDFGNWIT